MRWVVAIGLGLALLAVTRSQLVEIYRVPPASNSMSPTIEPGQRFVVDKVGLRLRSVARGDLVVLRTPEGVVDAEPVLVKRVVGLPGDDVRLDGGVLRVNDLVVDEPYLDQHSGPSATSAPMAWELGADDYLVLGDHRAVSLDSRSFGPVQRDQLIGTVRMVI